MKRDELMRKWIANLRSGKFRKCKGVSRTTDGKFCALGVLEYTRNKNSKFLKWGAVGRTTGRIERLLGLPIVHLNDQQNLSFKQIARKVEKSYENYLLTRNK